MGIRAAYLTSPGKVNVRKRKRFTSRELARFYSEVYKRSRVGSQGGYRVICEAVAVRHGYGLCEGRNMRGRTKTSFEKAKGAVQSRSGDLSISSRGRLTRRWRRLRQVAYRRQSLSAVSKLGKDSDKVGSCSGIQTQGRSAYPPARWPKEETMVEEEQTQKKGMYLRALSARSIVFEIDARIRQGGPLL